MTTPAKYIEPFSGQSIDRALSLLAWQGNKSSYSFDGIDDLVVANGGVPSAYPFFMLQSGYVPVDDPRGNFMSICDSTVGSGYYRMGINSSGQAQIGARAVGESESVNSGSEVFSGKFITMLGIWRSATDRELLVNKESVAVGVTSVAYNVGDNVSLGAVNRSGTKLEFFAGELLERGLVGNYDPTPAEIASLFADEPVPAKYRGATGTETTSGTLTVGKHYTITDYQAGDDFTNVGAASNATGINFVATGTTPTTWTNSSGVTDTGNILNLDSFYNLQALDSDPAHSHIIADVIGAKRSLSHLRMRDIFKKLGTTGTSLISLVDAQQPGHLCDMVSVKNNDLSSPATIDIGPEGEVGKWIKDLVLAAGETRFINPLYKEYTGPINGQSALTGSVWINRVGNEYGSFTPIGSNGFTAVEDTPAGTAHAWMPATFIDGHIYKVTFDFLDNNTPEIDHPSIRYGDATGDDLSGEPEIHPIPDGYNEYVFMYDATAVPGAASIIFHTSNLESTNFTITEFDMVEAPGEWYNDNQDASSKHREADATTGWGASAALSSVSSPVADGAYAISLTASAAGHNGWIDFNAFLPNIVNGDLFEIRLKVRHNGAGGAWVASMRSGGSGAIFDIADILTGEVEYKTIICNGIYDDTGVDEAIFASRLYFTENNVTNNGGIYVDAVEARIVPTLPQEIPSEPKNIEVFPSVNPTSLDIESQFRKVL